MRPFQHVHAPNLEAAVVLLSAPEALPIAGGTDLLTELKARIRTPGKLVNLKTIPDLRQIREENGSLIIGSLTSVSEIGASDIVRKRFPILSQAAATVGTRQIRNAGTSAGNLCQSVRCWYYRHPEVKCWLKGGDTCYARLGNSRLHAIFGKCPCIAVNPSDLAPALAALDAAVRIAAKDGVREQPVESLYRLPQPSHRKQTVLKPDELIKEIVIPIRQEFSAGIYLKVMERAAWSFALVSIAIQIDWNGDRVERSRFVFGGVAGAPWRALEAEKIIAGQKLDEGVIDAAAREAVRKAAPLESNRYKVPMAGNLLRKGLRQLAGAQRLL
ncbi:MAG: xanthine dehydrogenase family protein subunit M [Desulfobacteraceae bacterium]|nr:MAG: xanthine dehydrogenase family protein subunit M [Desulfobacteraceae bacterium]